MLEPRLRCHQDTGQRAWPRSARIRVHGVRLAIERRTTEGQWRTGLTRSTSLLRLLSLAFIIMSLGYIVEDEGSKYGKRGKNGIGS